MGRPYRLEDNELMACLDLYMNNQGRYIDPRSQTTISEFLDTESKERGYKSWQDAYWRIVKPKKVEG